MQLTEEHIRDMVTPGHEEYTPEIAELYSQIEQELIMWKGDDRTAGALTRRILVLIYDNINN